MSAIVGFENRVDCEKNCSGAARGEGAAGGREWYGERGEVGGARWQVRPTLCLRNALTHYCVTKYPDDMQVICILIYFNYPLDRTQERLVDLSEK